MNTENRKKAKNDFEKDFFKLMNNAVFGKTMENLRKRKEIHLVSDEAKALKLQPWFEDRLIIGNNLVPIEMKKKKILFNKPIYVGASILELSKTLMYKFHYDVMIPKFTQEKLKILYMDTDSFFNAVKSEDVYHDMLEREFHNMLDTSDYPKSHILFSDKNKKVIGKMKDEVSGSIIQKFIGLGSKLYAFQIFNDGSVKKKAKGVVKSVTQNQIRFEDYKKCLDTGKKMFRVQKKIVSKKHVICTYQFNKIALSNIDDKRHILNDNVSTLSYGHKDTSVL